MPCWTGAQFVSIIGIHCKVCKDKLVWIIFKNLACTLEITQFVFFQKTSWYMLYGEIYGAIKYFQTDH
jgi:hypothetical protein